MSRPVPQEPPSAITVVRTTAAFAPDSSHALQSLRLPGSGRPTPTTSPGVGVDDDLVVGRVPVALRLLGNLMVTGGDQGAVHDQHGVLAEPFAGLQSQRLAEVVDDPVGPPTSTPPTAAPVGAR